MSFRTAAHPTSLRRSSLGWLSALLIALLPATTNAGKIEGITFALDSKNIYVPLDEAAKSLGWSKSVKIEKNKVQVREHSFASKSIRTFTNGSPLISLKQLKTAGAPVTSNKEKTEHQVGDGGRSFTVTIGAKRAEINLKEQKLRAWQGTRQVLETRISSGKGGRTPSGKYTAGPYKARKHYSSRYNRAYMPYSVQVTGHIFIHGYKSVPKYPASHGCIRLPYLSDGNPARFFYEWVNKGTPIEIKRK